MRNNKIIPGLILVLTGVVILLDNYGYINLHWGNFFYLFPIFIVIWGINLIFSHKPAWATALKLVVVIIGFGLIVFGNFGRHHGFWNNYTYTYDDDNDSSDDNDYNNKGVVKIEGTSIFNQPFTNDVKVARLNIIGGGTIYKLSDTTNQLFYADTKEFKGKYVFDHSKQDSVYVLDFTMKNHRGFNLNWRHNKNNDSDSDKTNTATFKLNPNPEWEVNVEAGATKLNFDLAKFKIRSLKLKGGAAAFNVTLGQPLAVTNVIVETGMSDVHISIPESAACHITSSTGLASTRFEGFNETKDNDYETPGFRSAKNKMYIKISGGMASFKVDRY